MEFKKLKQFGTKFLKVTLKDGTNVKGHFLSYNSIEGNMKDVEYINLLEDEIINKVPTKKIEKIEII